MIYRWRKFLWLSLLVLSAVRSKAADAPLAPEQLACEERQLGRLVYRATAALPESQIFLWRSSSGGGLYQGLLATGSMVDAATSAPSRREDQLAFDLILKQEQDFLNPSRKPLPQATLVRRDKASSLGTPVFGYSHLTFELASGASNPLDPEMPLTITGFLSPEAGHADRAARSIAAEDLLTPCHSQVSAFDLKMFEILARTVRASDCLADPFSGCLFPTRFKASIFRGAEPLTYRMDLYRYDSGCFDDGTCSYGQGEVALLFRVHLDEAGRLSEGEVQVLPWCTDADPTGCTYLINPQFFVYVMPPLRPAFEIQGPDAFARSAVLKIYDKLSEDNVLYTTINWADLLRDTAWNGGGVP